MVMMGWANCGARVPWPGEVPNEACSAQGDVEGYQSGRAPCARDARTTMAQGSPNDKLTVTLSGAAFGAAESKGPHRVGRTLLSSSSL